MRRSMRRLRWVREVGHGFMRANDRAAGMTGSASNFIEE